jgi:hypothetical protein
LLSVYLLLVLVPVAVIAYLLWNHRRKAAEREAASAGRLQQILGAVGTERAAHDESTPVREAHAAIGEVARASVDYVRRERLLDPAGTLLYYLLRTALPDYIVFARVPLWAVLEPSHDLPAGMREEFSKRIASRTIDFLVSDRNLQPIAAVQFGTAGNALGATTSPGPSLIAAGVRYIELDAAHLPKKEGIRGIVLGEDSVIAQSQQDATTHAS